MKISLLILTHNEIEGMKVIMPRIDPSWCDQIIILDGGSTDGTVEWAREQGYFVYVQKQKGFRHAYFEGLPYIEGDTIITFSPDGNTIPEMIPPLIEKMREGYDMVIGSRYLDGAKSDDDDWLTAFGNWLFTRTVNFLYGGHYTDIMVIFRIYKKSLIYDLGLDREDAYALPEKLFFCKISWEPLMSVRALKKGKKVGEIPADEPGRIGGVRKLRIFRWGAAYFFQFWRELWFWRQ